MIALGCDHGGIELKEKVMAYLDKRVASHIRILAVTARTLVIILCSEGQQLRQWQTENVKKEL